MGRIFDVGAGEVIFDNTGRKKIVEQVSMAGLKTSGLFFDNSTPVTFEEIEPYLNAKGFSSSDPIVGRMMQGMNAAGQWTLYRNFVTDTLHMVDLNRLKVYSFANGSGNLTGYYPEGQEYYNRTTPNASNPFRDAYEISGIDDFHMAALRLPTLVSSFSYESTVVPTTRNIIACVDWDRQVKPETVRAADPTVSAKFLEYSADPSQFIADVQEKFQIDYVVDLGSFTWDDVWMKPGINSTVGQVSNMGLEWAGNLILTPSDLQGKMKLYLCSKSELDLSIKTWFLNLSGIDGVSLTRTTRRHHYIVSSDDRANNIAGETRVDELDSLPGLWQLANPTQLAPANRSFTGSGAPPSGWWTGRNSATSSQIDTGETQQMADVAVKTGGTWVGTMNRKVWLKLNGSASGWGRTFGNGFEDIEMLGGDMLFDFSDPTYPLLERTPQRVSARVQSETVIGLLEDIKSKPGISAADVRKLDNQRADLAENPTSFSCTFYNFGVPGVSGPEVEDTKLWKTILKEKPELLDDDLGEGMTLRKGKEKLAKFRADSKKWFAVCSSANTGEKNDFFVSNDSTLQEVLLASYVEVEKIDGVGFQLNVKYGEPDDLSIYNPDEATLQYIIAATTPVFTGVTQAEIEAEFGWDPDWYTRALDYVGAGAYSGNIDWYTETVAWDKVAAESFITRSGFPRIDFADVDTRARALLAFKALKDDGADFFLGSFFAANA